MFKKFLFMGYWIRTSNYPERITLSNPTHMMSMTDIVAISVETLRIDIGCSLEKEFTELIRMSPWMMIISNCQSGWFMSWLCMWTFDLRYQRYLVDGWSCFDYDLRTPSHVISKMSFIGFNMKSTKMSVWSMWDHPPSVIEEIDSINEMWWNSWPR